MFLITLKSNNISYHTLDSTEDSNHILNKKLTKQTNSKKFLAGWVVPVPAPLSVSAELS